MATTTQSTAATGARSGAASAAGTLETRTRNRIDIQRALLYTVLVVYGIFSLAPFVFALISSFKTEAQVLATPPTLLPNPATLHSYQFIFTNGDFPFGNYLFNSLVYAVGTAALNVVLAAAAG